MARNTDPDNRRRGPGVTFGGTTLYKDGRKGPLRDTPKKKTAPKKEAPKPKSKPKRDVAPPKTQVPTPKPKKKPAPKVNKYGDEPYGKMPKITGDNIPPVKAPPKPNRTKRFNPLTSTTITDSGKVESGARGVGAKIFGDVSPLPESKKGKRFNPLTNTYYKNGGRVRGDGACRTKTKGRMI